MTENTRLRLKFIQENLEHGDMTELAKKNKWNRDTVIKVKNGRITSKKILSALESVALRNRQHAIKVTEFNQQQ